MALPHRISARADFQISSDSVGVLARLSETDSLQVNSPSTFQSQVDTLTSLFLSEICQWKSLTAMMAGSLAYRMGRAGILALPAGTYGRVPLQWLSYGGGLASEATVFEGASEILGSGSPSSLKGEGEFRNRWLTTFVRFGLLKLGGAATVGENLLTQHLFQDAAMIAGEQVTAKLGLTPAPEEGLAEQWVKAEITQWQMTAGMGLLHFLTGGSIAALEKSQDLFLKSRGQDLFTLLSPDATAREIRRFAAPEGDLSRFFPETPSPTPPFFLSEGGREETRHTEKTSSTKKNFLFPSKREANRLREKFLPAFPISGPAYSEEIISVVLKTASGLPHFHERLLEYFSEAPDRGSREQLYTAIALQDAFNANGLASSTGGLNGLLLQLVAGQILSDPRKTERHNALQSLVSAMEKGLSRTSLQQISQIFGYADGLHSTTTPAYPLPFEEQFRPQIEREWKGYGTEDVIQLLNFLYSATSGRFKQTSRYIRVFGKARNGKIYDPRDIDQALRYARGHPFGKLILQRLFHVFALEDIPAKVRELRPESREDTVEVVLRYLQNGVPSETVAEKINGTRHTAYIHDIRLARKTVSVMQEIARFLPEPNLLRDLAKMRLDQAILSFLKSNSPLTPSILIDLLKTNPLPWLARLEELYRADGIRLEIVPKNTLDEEAKKWGAIDECDALFLCARHKDETDRILIMELPPPPPGDQDASFLYATLIHRLAALVHEFEHYRHTRGDYEGVEKYSSPLILRNIGREQRLVSEIMADLEEQRWRNRNIETDFWHIARRLGESLTVYLRNLNDMGYFGPANESLMSFLKED
ncbi:MAG: hypothetical protein U1F57_09570 [bacterium]